MPRSQQKRGKGKVFETTQEFGAGVGRVVKCGKVVVLKCFGYSIYYDLGLSENLGGNPLKTIGLSSHSPSDCNFVGAPWRPAPT